jgi:hypothetical protein
MDLGKPQAGLDFPAWICKNNFLLEALKINVLHIILKILSK